MGGGDTTYVQAPAAPQAPSVQGSMQDYVQNLPAMYEAQLEYIPKFAGLAQQVAEETYPITSGLQESLAGQAERGMQEGVPDWMREEYLSGIRAQLGENVRSPLGADAVSRGLMNQAEQQRRYSQQLALSLAGRQQLVQPPSYQTIQGGFTPGSVMGFNQGVYGTQANIYGTQASIAAQNAAFANQPSPWGQVAGSIAGGLGTGMGYGFGSMFG